MIGRILKLFRKAPVLVPGTAALAEGEARKVDIGDPMAGGTQILLCKVDGEVYAIDTLCPHEGARLSAGPLTDGRLALCPLHSYRFDPKTGKSVGVSCSSAKTYRTRETDEGTEVWL